MKFTTIYYLSHTYCITIVLYNKLWVADKTKKNDEHMWQQKSVFVVGSFFTSFPWFLVQENKKIIKISPLLKVPPV